MIEDRPSDAIRTVDSSEEGWPTRLQAQLTCAENRLIALSVLVFSLLGHAYRYTNTLFNHDSLFVFRNETDITNHLANGRWLHPLYFALRGYLSVPFVVGALSTIYLMASMMLIVRILHLEKAHHIVLLSGLMATASSITLTNASFIESTDEYLLCFLLSVTAAYLLVCHPRGWVPAIGCYVLSLGLYQAYIEVGVLLSLLHLLRECLRDRDTSWLLRQGAKACFVPVAALALYALITAAALRIPETNPNAVATGITNATILSGDIDLVALVVGALKILAKHIVNPLTFHRYFSGAANVCILLIALVALARCLKGRRRATVGAAVLIACLCPLAANFVYVFYPGDNSLATLPWVILYGGAAMLVEQSSSSAPTMRWHLRADAIACVLSAILIANGIIYANQVYLKRDLEEQATLSTMTRVLAQMEAVEGYQPGTTEVVLIGLLDYSPLSQSREGFDQLDGRALEWNMSTTYYRTYYAYLTQILGYPTVFVDAETAASYSQSAEVLAMPSFPAEGCCRMMDNKLIVKLSDPA